MQNESPTTYVTIKVSALCGDDIVKDVILSANSNRIEIWAKEEYEKHVNLPDGDFSALGEKVLGDPPKTQS